jgi:hypothetical protein
MKLYSSTAAGHAAGISASIPSCMDYHADKEVDLLTSRISSYARLLSQYTKAVSAG